MTFHQQVNFIHQRIFNEDYHTFIQNRYQQEQQDSYFKKIEEAYQRGIEHLEHALDNIRRRELAEIESRYAKQHSIVSELSFCSGLCMSFEHYFHRNDQACGRTAMKVSTEMREFHRHPECRQQSQEVLALLKHLRKSLNREAQEHLTSIECAWDERLHNAARHSCYLGYHTGLSVLEKLHPMQTLYMTPQLLITEYELGYISTYRGVDARLSTPEDQNVGT